MMKGETMTLTEISRYFHLNETIQKNREALKFLRERLGYLNFMLALFLLNKV